MVSEVAFLYPHLPKSFLVIVGIPFQADMIILYTIYRLGGSYVLFCPGLSPSEGKHAFIFFYVVGKPPLQSVSTANLIPNDVRRHRCQRVFNVYSLLRHTLRVVNYVSSNR